MKSPLEREREELEAELRHSRALLSSAFDKSPLMLSVADLLSDRYLEVNDAFCACVGFSREEVVGRTAVELGMITPEGRDRLARELMQMVSAGRRYPLEFEIRRRNGPPIFLRYWFEVNQSAEGVRIFAAAEDITEAHRRALDRDDAMKQLDERFALAMDAASDGLWDWDLATNSSYFSPGLHRQLGLPLGGLDPVGDGWLGPRVHADDRANLQTSLRECREGKRPGFSGEYRIQPSQGDWLWMLVRGQAVAHDEQGKPRRLLATFVDVSERKRLQLGLAQNERMASLGMLSAGVAHEINNPLAWVISNLELMLVQLGKFQPPPGGELTELAGLAREALEGSERVRKISRTLSTFSRVEPAELGAVDVNTAIEDAVKMAHAEVRYRATLVKELAQVPAVRASSGKLAQVVLNLLVNAAHACDAGPVEQQRITVRSFVDGGHVVLEVSDSGVGIPPEHRERVFEPFFTTRRAGVGSGLGLAISRRLVSEFGGDISLESTVGQGTQVRVRLPVLATAVEPTEPPAAPTPSAPTTSRGRVLIVDDEPLIRRTLSRHFSRHHEVVTAGTGREAKELVERDAEFDVVFCDLMMPEMSGMDFHAWLVGHDAGLASRVIFVSGGAFTPNAASYLSRVENLRLEKPFDLQRMLELAAEHVARRRAGK